MNITIINDCKDVNAAGRQVTRAAALCDAPVSYIAVHNDIEAAGNLIDTLDALDGHKGIVLVNVAPRNGAAKKWKNGTPFGYFWCNNTLVVATIDGYTLSLIKKFGLAKDITVLEVADTLDQMIVQKQFSPEKRDTVVNTQFRSLNFSPHVAAFLWAGYELAGEAWPITNVPDAPPTVWWIDNFGNCKTTLTTEDLNGQDHLETIFGTLPYHPRLKDVPDGEMAVITGSSGFGEQRFLELVAQDVSGSFTKQHTVTTGMPII